MLYAPKPKSAKISEYFLENGSLILRSEAQTLRLTPVSDKILRISALPDGVPSDDIPPEILPYSNSCEFKLSRDGKSISFSSGELKTVISEETGSIEYFGPSGLYLREAKRESRLFDGYKAKRRFGGSTKKVMTADGEKTVVVSGEEEIIGDFYHTWLRLCFSTDEAIYGLGQHEEGFSDLRGKTVYSYHANRKIAIPLLVSTKGWGILMSTESPIIYNDNEYGSYIYSETVKQLDFYFLAGGSPDGVIALYRQLTGKAGLLPKWAFGYMQSRERYESFSELLDIAREFRSRKIGVDCLIQDWCSWPQGEWGQKSFDPVSYPDPDKNIDELHSLGVKLILSIWPNPAPSTGDYAELDKNGELLITKDFYNSLDPCARKTYWNQLERGLYRYGVDGWWCDNSEPFSPEWNLMIRKPECKAYDDFILAGCDRLPPDRLLAYPFHHAQAVYEGQRNVTDQKRVVNLTRCAYSGSQRYSCILWSGDICASWDTLKKQVAAGTMFSASGLPYWTVDIGGFFVKNSVSWYWKGDYDSPESDKAYWELYLRWYQWAAFLPIFRAHGTDLKREPWVFQDSGDTRFYDAMLKANRLRYSLIPYIYSAAAMAYFEDGSIIKPLGFDYPDDPVARSLGGQYMFGKSLMVCPVTEPMYSHEAEPGCDRTVKVYLPAGGWYHFFTGAYYEGGGWIDVSAPLDSIPVFVKEGSVLPIAKESCRVLPKEIITYRVYPGRDGCFSLYEDSADGYGYERGEYSITNIVWDDKLKTLTASDSRKLSYIIVG